MTARLIVALAILLGVSLHAAPPRLRVTADGRHLETVEGKPFFMLADTAWELFHRLKDDEVDIYLKTRAAQGFNVIYAVALPEFDLSVPDAYGNLQLHDNDPTKPNEAWFAHIDSVVKKASDLGLYIGFLPTWGDKWNKRWGKGPEIFTPENARTYGEWLGKRYADAPLIWILGGDRPVETDTHRAIIRNMAEGLRSGDGGTHLISFHPSGTKNSADFWPDEPWLSFHMFQSGHGRAKDKANYEYNLRNRALRPVKPTLDGEPRYEDHPVRGIPHEGDEWYDTFDVRQAAWWDVMSGSCGHTYGDHNIWQFLSPERPPITLARTPWKTALTHDGAIQMGYMRAFFEKMDWQKLEPRDDILTGDKGEGGSRMLALMTPEGDNAVVYSPHGKDVAIADGKFKKPLRASWFNPRTNSIDGSDVFALGFTDHPGTLTFSPLEGRGKVGRGHDCVLWLRSER